MKKTVNKILCVLLSAVMLFTLLPAFSALAGTAPGIVASGYCGGEGDGTNLTWTLDSEGTLTVTGEGAMADYADAKNQPWKEYGASIQFIVIKSGVSYIGKYAFADVDYSVLTHDDYYPNLTAVELENGVARIGENAFTDSGITAVTIPDSVQTLDDYAFYGCDRLACAVLPEGITNIPQKCFSGCPALASVTLPSTLTTIGESAFAGCGFEEITIPSGVTYIGENAFSASKLKSVIVPEGVTQLVSGAFHNCRELVSVTLPNSLEYIASSMFSGCYALETISIPNSVRVLDPYAFSGCLELSSVFLPDSVETIMPGVFKNCGKLQTISFPAGLKKLSGTALIDTLWYQQQPEGPVYFGDFLYNYKGEMPENTVFEIPFGTRGIGGKAFANQANLVEIHIPDSVLYICENAFSYCSGLQSIICPDSVKVIGEYAFNNCSALTELYLGNSVEYIQQGFIMECNALTELVIPGTVVFDAKANIHVCNQLSRVVLMPGIERLPNYFFWFCPSLKEISWPVSITSVGDSAFNQAQNVTDIYYEGTPEQWQQISWGGYNSLPDVTVHYNSHLHTPGTAVTENETPAGCVSEGGYDSVIYCAQCDHEFSRTHVTVNANGHTPGETARENEVAATCTADGGYDEVVYCTQCPAEISRTHVTLNALGHAWGEWQVVKEPTVEEEGLKRRTCANDASHVEELPIPKLDPPAPEDPGTGSGAGTVAQFLARIRETFRGIIDWFLRLFGGRP